MYRSLKENDGTTAAENMEIGQGTESNMDEEYVGTIPVGFDLSTDPIPITWKDILCFKVRTKVSGFKI